MGEDLEEKRKGSTRSNYRGFYFPDSFVPILDEFGELCKREGESASQKIRDWILNYVRIHGTILNPQRPMNGFLEKSGNRVQIPAPDKPMPDYWHMTDQELLALIKRPWGISYGDRQVILGILKRRKVKLGETLSGARNLA